MPEEPLPLRWAVAERALGGEEVSGDGYVIKRLGDHVLLAAVDGLGHGEDAAAAMRTAVEVLDAHAGEPLPSLLERCHQALLRSRGAAITLVDLDLASHSLEWVGVGNVSACLLREDPDAGPRESAMLLGGVVGYQLPRLRPSSVQWKPGDILIMATDGVEGGFAETVARTGDPEEIAETILEDHGRESDDALVLVVRPEDS